MGTGPKVENHVTAFFFSVLLKYVSFNDIT